LACTILQASYQHGINTQLPSLPAAAHQRIITASPTTTCLNDIWKVHWYWYEKMYIILPH